MLVLAMSDNWPTEQHIDNVAHNGEPDAPVYELGDQLYRVNPVGVYALYWTGKKWQESASIKNDWLIIKGLK